MPPFQPWLFYSWRDRRKTRHLAAQHSKVLHSDNFPHPFMLQPIHSTLLFMYVSWSTIS